MGWRLIIKVFFLTRSIFGSEFLAFISLHMALSYGMIGHTAQTSDTSYG